MLVEAPDRPTVLRLTGVPVIMTIYLVLTVLAFRFGPWPWPVKQPEYLYVYLASAIALFLIGSIGGAKNQLDAVDSDHFVLGEV